MIFEEDCEDFEKSFTKLIFKVKRLKKGGSEPGEKAYSVGVKHIGTPKRD